MLPGDYEHSADVRELTTYVIVNGVRRDFETVSFDCELSDDLPSQVAGANGVAGSTGKIVWAEQTDVQHREVSPWHKPVGWPPSSGDRVQVYVTDGTTSYPRFTGRIDRTTGVVGGQVQSSIIDDRDKLNTLFTYPALLRHHVPHGENNPYRSVGLNHWFILVAALRKAGLYNVPGLDAPTAVSATMQGSMWAEAGTVSRAHGTQAGTNAGFHRAPWGYTASGFDVSYLPRLNYSANNQVMISLSIAEDSAGVAYVDTMYGTDRLRLLVDPDRTTKAYWGSVLVCQLSASQMEGATRVSLLVRTGSWALRNDTGREATGTQATSSSDMSLVRVFADTNARVAGLIVDHPNTSVRDRRYINFSPSMRFEPGGLATTMDMSPRIEDRPVAGLIDEICKATLTASWWDEMGILRFASADRLRGVDPVQSVTTLDDITALTWEDSILSVRKQVQVTWEDASISKGRGQRKELFRGPRDTMSSGDEIEVFAVPDNNTEWFGVDRVPGRLDDSNWGFYSTSKKSHMGIYYTNSDGDELPSSTATTTIRAEEIGTVGIKIIHIAGNYPPGVEASLGTSETSIYLRPAHQGVPLPVIRGYGEGKWVEETTSSSADGPSYAPDLTHDLGRWGHRYFDGGSVAQRIADWLMPQVASPSPTIPSVEVTYDPRRQVGDVITAELGLLDVNLRVLIVGIHENHQPGAHKQSLTVRVISATSTRNVTYEELQAAWSGGTYAQLEAVWAGLTYSDLARTPLEGAPND